jgi:hypothetical protein
VAKFKHLEKKKTVTNENCIHEEINSRLNSENACYNSVQSLCSRLLLKNFKIKIYKTMIYLSLSLTLREEHRLRVFVNRRLRRIFGPKREEVGGGRLGKTA